LDEELGELQAPQKRALSAMEECIGRLRRIIDNLLDVTGLETGRMRFARQRYDFLEVAKRALEDHRERVHEARLSLAVELPTTQMPAIGDEDRLLRAMGQLLDNAIKFTPTGGALGLRVRVLEGGLYELCVADTGSGVPPARQDQIFEAFYQVDGSVTREHGGTGVGLAIARRTARGLGGDLRVVSSTDETIGGVRFGGAKFHLVVAPDAPGELAVESPT
jgi:signal transduction histidine kinase